MCGITGILSFNRPINPIELSRFTNSLSHRGPDGEGTYIDGPVGLGHRRLAILDLNQAGQCPMPYGGADGRRYWITFNGEVYNFLELKKELLNAGFTFRTETDTEVVVAAYAHWGEDCLFHFNGMWAFAIWDSHAKTLFLARDRFGIKPLYYLGTDRFAFASELKAFLSLDGFTPALNTHIVPTLLSRSYAYEGTTDQTTLKGVQRLPAGHALTINPQGQGRLRKWWETRDHIPAVPSRYEEQVERFRELFLDAVRIRMRSDVPVGTCLSGGVDSSAVVSSMAYLQQGKRNGLERCPRDWQQTFITSFPGSELDERRYAEQVVEHIGARPHYWVFDPNTTTAHIVESVWAMDDVCPDLGVEAWATYRTMRQNNVVVSLDGHGGDELLCGYSWYLDWPMNQVNDNLYKDFHYTLMPTILRNYDRCSMASGVEVRMPIMDWRLVTFAFGLKAESKIGGGFTKRVFREAMKGIMPEAIRVRRQKIGFALPLFDWYNDELLPFIRKVTNHRLWLESPFWNGAQLREQIIRKSEAGAWSYNDWGECLRVWTYMNLVIWQLLFVEQDISDIL